MGHQGQIRGWLTRCRRCSLSWSTQPAGSPAAKTPAAKR